MSYGFLLIDSTIESKFELVASIPSMWHFFNELFHWLKILFSDWSISEMNSELLTNEKRVFSTRPKVLNGIEKLIDV